MRQRYYKRRDKKEWVVKSVRLEKEEFERVQAYMDDKKISFNGLILDLLRKHNIVTKKEKEYSKQPPEITVVLKTVFLSEISENTIHRISKERPEMDEKKFNSLKNSIDVYGQFVPILVYRGKIVDGKHRIKALSEIGEQFVKVWDIPKKYSLKDIECFIDGIDRSFSRLTATQRAILVWKRYGQKKTTLQVKEAEKMLISYKLVRDIERLDRMGKHEIIEKLSRGETYRVSGQRETDAPFEIIEELKRTKCLSEWSSQP